MHIVIWGEGITPIFAAQWLRKLSSTVDILPYFLEEGN